MLHRILHGYKIFAFTLSKTNTNFYQIVVSMALHSNFFQKFTKLKYTGRTILEPISDVSISPCPLL